MDNRGRPGEAGRPERNRGSALPRVPKRAELIAASFRRDIVLGVSAEGDLLPSEAQLVERFGVSRPTIREAFRILESEGLIELRQGSRGARVKAPSEEAASRTVGLLLQFVGATLADIWDARILLEPPLAARLAKNRTRSDLKVLRKSLDEHHATVDDPAEFARVSTDFHSLVVNHAGSTAVSLLVSLLDGIFRTHATQVALDESPELNHTRMNKHTCREHEKLFALIEEGSGEEAEAFWRRHLESVAALLLRQHGAKTVLELVSSADASWWGH